MPHRVVIIGAGFAGLNAAKGLGNADAEVTVVDRRNFHLFQPLLYQVATGALSPGEIAAPVRNIVSANKNTHVVMADVSDIDVENRVVQFHDGGIAPYDTLVVATGATHHYFGHPEWAKFAPGLKSIEDATEIRRRLLNAFESAERETDLEKRKALMTFLIAGGGATGVEMAGAIAEVARDTLRHDFRNIDPRESRILLIEGADRLLPVYTPKLSEAAKRSLEKLGVEVRLKAMVTAVDENGATVKTGGQEERIETHTMVWAAGVAASPLGKILAQKAGAQLSKPGTVIVQPDCTIAGHPEIFVTGDLASFIQDGKPVPGVAPGAIQMGNYVAKNIKARLRGEQPKPFHYWDKGSLATIGRGSAVAWIGPAQFSGPIAWLAWLLIHLMYLVGFENRLTVLTEWAFNYFTHNRSARLITNPRPETLAD